MNCKKGDLAVIIADPEFGGRDVGKIVKVLQAAEPYSDGWPLWEIRTVGGQLVAWCDIDDMPTMDTWTVIPDAWLRPIRGEEEPESIVREMETT